MFNHSGCGFVYDLSQIEDLGQKFRFIYEESREKQFSTPGDETGIFRDYIRPVASPGHQLPFSLNMFLPSIKKDFNYLCHIGVE